MKEQGIQVTVVSNNNEQRVKDFADPLGIPFIHSARKPFVRAFKRAIQDMQLQPDEVGSNWRSITNGCARWKPSWTSYNFSCTSSTNGRISNAL